MVNESDAIEIMSIFRSKGIQIYLDGGWGVDALIGFESRCHNDIDIFIEKQDKECSIKLLNDNGYSETVMAYTTPEHTVWRDGNARIIDLHIFSRNSKGDLVFESETFPKEVFTGKGHIGHLEVDCITPEWQVRFHSGYKLDENDVKDVLLLCDKFNLALPDEIAQNFNIDTNRLTLRRWRENDAEALYKYASDGRVSEMALWPRHTSVDMSREVIKDFFQPNPFTLAMVLKETNEPIGCIGLVPAGAEHYKPLANEREVGYWIGFPYWGKGLTTEALKAMIEFCRNNIRLDSLLITTDAANKASQRVAEKCGFVNFTDYDNNGTPSKAFRLSLSSLAIRKVDDGKRDFIDLLLIGDESEDMIMKYLDRGNLYVGSMDNKDVAVIVTVEKDNGSVEIKNLAVDAAFRRRGIGRKMLVYVEKLYPDNKIILGTGETPSTLRFYRSCGYRYSYRISNFFTDNYPNPIVEEEVTLRDMVYLYKYSNKNDTEEHS